MFPINNTVEQRERKSYISVKEFNAWRDSAIGKLSVRVRILYLMHRNQNGY